ncbi:hypothetical protein [Streptomyces luteocolor]|uniref:hypothetical protein n=1 Tax=Streptomyces luteocolor TaxID=285500 RepID=UPI0008538121|nr:hypothetical protein [Streptomyces luteocolor]
MNQSDSGFEKASLDVISVREILAARVRQELERAGIPTTLLDVKNPDNPPGAEIDVDLGADVAGGVFVKWNTSQCLRGAAGESLMRQEFQAATIKHNGAVGSLMCTAMVGILQSAGFQAIESEDDMRPSTVEVKGWSEPAS